ncbi:MAG: carbohydrate ABC transporter permease [Lachnospiraceae bacterium]|nr:carbohydrate ABC transporter permease [Lachnospiraceae bacterium]
MVEHPSVGDRVVDLIVILVCALVAFCSLVPMWHVLMSSLSDGKTLLASSGVAWLPVGDFNLDDYKHIFKDSSILTGYANTLLYTVASTVLGFFLAVMTGYAMSRDTKLKGFMILAIMLPMLFSGGMVPTYMVIRKLGWVGTRWALIVPGCTNAMFMIMMMNAFNSVPKEMYEAARIDGAGHFRTMARIMLPQAMNLGSVIIQDAYQRELDTAMNGLVSDLENIEERFSGFLISYMTELTLEEVNNPLTALEMLEELHGVRESGGRDGMAWLYDKEGERLYLKYTAGSYEIARIEELKRALEERISKQAQTDGREGGENTKNWEYLSLPQGQFLSRQYEYTNYYAGFLLDMEKYLDTLGTPELWRRNRVYLKSCGLVYSFQSGKLRLYTSADWEGIFSGWYGRNVFWEAPGMDLDLGLRVVDREFGTAAGGWKSSTGRRPS